VPESPSDPYEEAYSLIKEKGDWLGALNALDIIRVAVYEIWVSATPLRP